MHNEQNMQLVRTSSTGLSVTVTKNSNKYKHYSELVQLQIGCSTNWTTCPFWTQLDSNQCLPILQLTGSPQC